MSTKVLILGAGFGGLELSTILSEKGGGEFDVTLIDKNDSFVFGYSKLDVMFGRETADAVRHSYSDLAKPDVRLLRETVTSIDPENRRVTTDAGEHEADVLVVALGADYDIAATPGLEKANEFYSVAGAAELAAPIAEFSQGHAIIGVCGAPFKCPPAPSEAALLLNDMLVERGVRDDCEISFVIPLSAPVPPSPETSAALRAEFDQRGINLITGKRIASIDPERKVAVLDDDTELPYDLFLGVPKHRAPDVVIESGMTENGYIPVDSATLKTSYEGVYAVGDVCTAGVPKAGVFAEGAAKVVASKLLAEFAGGPAPDRHLGQGSCYIEFGEGRVARVDIDFLSGPEKTGEFNAPSKDLVAEKENFGSSRRLRWFDS